MVAAGRELLGIGLDHVECETDLRIASSPA